jgi:hypothetical protein
MNTCKNSECRKEIPENLNYCNEECLRKHQEIKREAKSKPQIEESPRNRSKKNNTEPTVNTGTENKSLLQEQALRFMKTYPKDRTARQYACLLCWDIRVSQRTAMESYIEPMIAHGILVPSGNNQYRLSPEYE